VLRLLITIESLLKKIKNILIDKSTVDELLSLGIWKTLLKSRGCATGGLGFKAAFKVCLPPRF
jgi:hypothetical protein